MPQSEASVPHRLSAAVGGGGGSSPRGPQVRRVSTESRFPRSRSRIVALVLAPLLLASATACDPSLLGGKSEPTTRGWTVSGGPQSTGTPESLGGSGGAGGVGGGVTLGSDPRPAEPVGVKIDLWAVAVPRGAVSANEAFWKRVDENAVRPDRYDLLFKNGFRVGVARADDWGYFRRLLSEHPARHQLNAVTVFDEQNLEVPVRKGVDVQTLSYFGPDGQLSLRTYDKCENLLQFSMSPAPRRPDAARIALAPVVRSTRERVEFTPANEERTVRVTTPERLYDLALSVEVPFGQFLVISPSTDTARQTSIGRNFLLLDNDAEQQEIVLLIVPTRVDLTRTPPQAPQTPPPAGAGPKAPAK